MKTLIIGLSSIGSLTFAIVWLYCIIIDYIDKRRYDKYNKAMMEEIKKNDLAFNQALNNNDFKKCDELTRQFENWCQLNQPK